MELIRFKTDGEHKTKIILDMMGKLQLKVQVHPPEAPWYLSVLESSAQLIMGTATLRALEEGGKPSGTE